MHFLIVAHGKSEKIVIESILSSVKYRLQNGNSIVFETIAPDPYLSISSTQTTNLKNNIESTLKKVFSDKEKGVFLLEKLGNKELGIIIYIDICEKNTNNSKNLEDAYKKNSDEVRNWCCIPEMENYTPEVYLLYNIKGIENALGLEKRTKDKIKQIRKLGNELESKEVSGLKRWLQKLDPDKTNLVNLVPLIEEMERYNNGKK